MCFEFDARPPDLPADRVLPGISGGAGAESIVLTSSDGNRFAAALAESPEPSGAAVVILPDVRGLYRFYVELAERLAEAGHHAIAFDYFGGRPAPKSAARTSSSHPRSSGRGPRRCSSTSPPPSGARRADGRRHLRQPRLLLRRDAFVLRGDEAGARALGSDRFLWAAGTGASRERGEPPEPDRERTDISVPVLGLFGGADQAIPAEDVEAFDRALDSAGVEHQLITYPGAPHSFFDRSAAEHAEASDDAWRRVLDFLASASP